GLSERERAQPPVVWTKHSRTLASVRGLLAPLPGCDPWCVAIPGVRKKRVPLAKFLAPLRGANAKRATEIRARACESPFRWHEHTIRSDGGIYGCGDYLRHRS